MRNRQEILAWQKEYYQKHKERIKARVRAYQANNRDKVHAAQKRRHLKATLKHFGLTLEWYDEQLAAQGYCCAICGEQKPLAIDHCHLQNKVRALLCIQCNAGLGHFRDDPETMRRAAIYIEAFAA